METHSVVERVARESWGRLVAFLTAQCGDLAAAEDAVAEALRSALDGWPQKGIPGNPEAWLLVVGRRRLQDTLRHAHRYEEFDPASSGITEFVEISDDGPFRDERLQMLFLCAHPAIDKSIHTPLMLQAVLGLTAERIASAFLVRPSTMGQRLSRAKAKIRQAKIRFELPERFEMPGRLAAVLEAIYAAYGTGWDDPAGSEPSLRGLTQEAIFLGQLLVELLPDEGESHGLLALMLYCESRSAARRSSDGSYIPLAEQSCELWSKDQIAEAEQHLAQAATLGAIGRFQLEAAIQSAHAQRIVTGSRDWAAIESLYRMLVAIAPTAGAIIAHIAAVSEVYGAKRALELVEALPPEDFAQYQPWWALLADLQQKTGRGDAARSSYQRAVGLSQDAAVRRFLLERARNS